MSFCFSAMMLFCFSLIHTSEGPWGPLAFELGPFLTLLTSLLHVSLILQEKNLLCVCS